MARGIGRVCLDQRCLWLPTFAVTQPSRLGLSALEPASSRKSKMVLWDEAMSVVEPAISVVVIGGAGDGRGDGCGGRAGAHTAGVGHPRHLHGALLRAAPRRRAPRGGRQVPVRTLDGFKPGSHTLELSLIFEILRCTDFVGGCLCEWEDPGVAGVHQHGRPYLSCGVVTN